MSVRFDERTLMLLDELSAIIGTDKSVLIRTMVMRCMDELIDQSGNWKVNREKDKERKDQQTSDGCNR